MSGKKDSTPRRIGAKWHYDNFEVPNKKGPVAFFNGLKHKVILDWDFNPDDIAAAIDEIYTDFELFDVEDLSSILPSKNDHERFRALASAYIQEHLLKRLYEVFGQLAGDSLRHALSSMAKDKEPKRVPKQTQLDISRLANSVERLMRDRSAPGPGRPEGSGATFKSEEDFLVVLQYGFDNYEGKLGHKSVWAKMHEHELFKKEKADVGTLDIWIKRSGFENWTEAKKKLHKRNKS